MKLYINRNQVRGPWGGGAHFFNNFYKEVPNLGHEVCRSSDFCARPDVIFIAGLEADNGAISVEQAISYKMYLNPDAKLILRVNENDARKSTNHVDDLWVRVSEYVDGSVFVSNWLRNYFLEKGWKCKNNTVIYNGVDREIFKSNKALDNDKNNIVAHHWSQHENKGFDIYEKIDEFVGQNTGFTFTYIGRHRNTFKNTKIIEPLFGEKLGCELGKYDVYVSASRWDPGPNHCLEAIACKLPTFVHKDGGGAVEFAGTNHVYNDWQELKSLLTVGSWTHNNDTFLSTWSKCIEQYVTFAESLK